MIRFPSVSWPESKLVITRVGIPRHLITAKRAENLLWVVDSWIPELKALGPGKSFICHRQDQEGTVWGTGLVTLTSSLPTFLSSSPWSSQKRLPAKAASCSDKHCQGQQKSSKSRVPLLGPAGQKRHTSFGKNQ